ncbi:aminotransferase class V-fold PLP-dependent enzyme [Xanthovirga aplysinae]|uniref:aminotransferase class V-fold PLP-dependent enzyme n=1 Tax=Xanthovirga aplysinae TaxID=2529853 RepID=UPI0012BC7D8B|nr:aminotransferase class V-fold PLP-dependent enzyme [Xanthovirga aplysinae]MTI32283.1 aminotransferase class V-fold PLP-dependent enzyme [Xanthovirga aplysinae]
MKTKITRSKFIKNTFLGNILYPFYCQFFNPIYKPLLERISSKEFDPLREGNSLEDDYWKMLRLQFPLTRDRNYFNTGGLGPSPQIVIDTVYEWMLKLETISESGYKEVASVHKKAASLFRVKPKEIAITRNTTEGVNIMARSLPLKRGDEVLMTTHEHPGAAIPWIALKKDKGINIKLIEPDLSGENNFQIIEQNISSKTKVVAIPHVTCTNGMILPVKEIAAFCKSKNIFFCVDGAQAVGMINVDLEDISPDLYATSGHKWLLGPKGSGLLYMNESIMEKLNPVYVGPYSVDNYSLNELEQTYRKEANREEYATRATPLIMGLGAAIDFITSVGIKDIEERGRKLSTYLIEELQKIRGIEILSPSNPEFSSAIVTFKLKGKDFKKIQASFRKDYQCRLRGIVENNLNALRVSCGIQNSFEELDKLLLGVKNLASS